MSVLAALAAALVLLPVEAGPPPLTPIHAAFDYDKDCAGERHRVRGECLIIPPGRLIVSVREPIRQWITLDSASTVVYFPDERKAFRTGASVPFSTPFHQLLLGAAGAEPDLTGLGFRLIGKERRSDSLLTRWGPPPDLAERGEIRLVLHQDRLVRIDLLGEDGECVTRSLYRRFSSTGPRAIPLELETIDYRPPGCRERVSITELSIDGTAPDSLASFRVPAGVAIDDIGSD